MSCHFDNALLRFHTRCCDISTPITRPDPPWNTEDIKLVWCHADPVCDFQFTGLGIVVLVGLCSLLLALLIVLAARCCRKHTGDAGDARAPSTATGMELSAPRSGGLLPADWGVASVSVDSSDGSEGATQARKTYTQASGQGDYQENPMRAVRSAPEIRQSPGHFEGAMQSTKSTMGAPKTTKSAKVVQFREEQMVQIQVYEPSSYASSMQYSNSFGPVSTDSSDSLPAVQPPHIAVERLLEETPADVAEQLSLQSGSSGASGLSGVSEVWEDGSSTPSTAATARLSNEVAAAVAPKSKGKGKQGRSPMRYNTPQANP